MSVPLANSLGVTIWIKEDFDFELPDLFRFENGQVKAHTTFLSEFTGDNFAQFKSELDGKVKSIPLENSEQELPSDYYKVFADCYFCFKY